MNFEITYELWNHVWTLKSCMNVEITYELWNHALLDINANIAVIYFPDSSTVYLIKVSGATTATAQGIQTMQWLYCSRHNEVQVL